PVAPISRVLVGLRPGDPVLDLARGPGTLAIPFARADMRVTGVDPEPEMLAAPMGAARDAQVEIELRRGSSFDMPAGIGPSRLVTMGRAFHWMGSRGDDGHSRSPDSFRGRDCALLR